MLFDQIFSFVNKFKPKYDDDVVDRLNYVYTNWLIVLFSIIVACRQYIGSPLECWVPAQFQRGWEEYVENYCFVESTYYVAMEEEMPNSLIERGNRRLKYYQWVPLILALEAFLFYFPRFIWRAFHWKAGLDITSIMQHAMTTEKVGKLKVLKTQKKEDMADLAQYFDDVLKHQISGSDEKSLFAKVLSNHCGMYITLLYLFVKLLNIINVFSQLAILNG
uniref:Innexin n=1 Tax=Plectus sambesii TaxID=2011161 RepID=A0A914UKK5_9BILA